MEASGRPYSDLLGGDDILVIFGLGKAGHCTTLQEPGAFPITTDTQDDLGGDFLLWGPNFSTLSSLDSLLSRPAGSSSPTQE